MMEIFTDSEAKQWNEIVLGCVNGSLFHHWEWLKIVEKNSGTRLFPLVFFDTKDNRPFGIIPLFYQKRLGIKMVFSPPPGSAIRLGPLLANKGYRQHKFELAYLDFQQGIEDFVTKQGSHYVNIVTSPGLEDMRPFLWAHYEVSPFYTYKIDLKPGENSVWNNLSQSLKTNIKKAPRRGITVTESMDLESVEYVYDLLIQRYTRQKRHLPLKLAYLRDLFQHYGKDNLKVYLARYEDRIVGGQAFVVYKDTMISWVGGNRCESNNIECNEMIMWHTIQKAIQDGFRWFEIEGANTRHLCDAKSRYCPDLSIYFKAKKMNFMGNILEKAYTLRNSSGRREN